MKFLANVLITTDRITLRSESRPTTNDRVNIFKYTLASWAALEPILEETILYIGVDKMFDDRINEIYDWIIEVYQMTPTIHWYKNKTQKEYQETYDELFADGEELVLYNGNDDHVFFDYSLDLLESASQHLIKDSNPEAVLYYGCFPEMCRTSFHHNGELTADGNFVIFSKINYDSIQLMKKERWYRYWFSEDFSHIENIRRSDDLSSLIKNTSQQIYAPTRTLFRHFDGYSHIGEFTNTVPELYIPDGFFESKIKIRYGYADRKDGWVNINPSAKYLYTCDDSGVDYRWMFADIPLFWRPRISEYAFNMKLTTEDIERMVVDRNRSFLESTQLPMRSYGIEFDSTNLPPERWYEKHLR